MTQEQPVLGEKSSRTAFGLYAGAGCIIGVSLVYFFTFLFSVNFLVVGDQPMGTSVRVALVSLRKPGFLFLHEPDQYQKPGEIIGMSSYLAPGIYKNIHLAFKQFPSTAARSGAARVLVSLYEDNGNKAFETEGDTPVRTVSGKRLYKTIILR